MHDSPLHTPSTPLPLSLVTLLCLRTKLKCRLETPDGQWVERIPAWIKWATQEWNEIQYNGVNWEPEDVGVPGEVHSDKKYVFKYPRPPK